MFRDCFTMANPARRIARCGRWPPLGDSGARRTRSSGCVHGLRFSRRLLRESSAWWEMGTDGSVYNAGPAEDSGGGSRELFSCCIWQEPSRVGRKISANSGTTWNSGPRSRATDPWL